MKKETHFCVSSHVGGKETLTDVKNSGKNLMNNKIRPCPWSGGRYTGLEGFVHILRFFLLFAAVQE